VAETKKDDIVEVLRYKREGGLFKEHWIPCIVVWTDEHGINVKPLKGTFNEAGQDLLALPRSEYGKMWRR
jgi:hypothetical protein